MPPSKSVTNASSRKKPKPRKTAAGRPATTGKKTTIKLSGDKIPATTEIPAWDETNAPRRIKITGERPLTLYADGRELVTLMTLGAMPEALALGWLRNQRMLSSARSVEEIIVDWEVNAAAIRTHRGLRKLKSDQRTITSGCGQGTVFGDMMEEVEKLRPLRRKNLTRAALWDLLDKIRERETVYKESGAVHGCALATHGRRTSKILIFTEDVGRHNAVDAIAGWMWLNGVPGSDKVFYTTGRLTSEMVVKCAQMRIPFLVSRSGLTQMGWDVANRVGLTMLGRAMNRRYFLFTGREFFSE